ncbi:MAG: 4-hydroxy-tetrahydrodipicolinate synthase [Demequinaceae bacterium]|nr:4-hydroxy-tetrahydrodipicolinate synthase [Demequinaceae bacterium]
MVQQTPPFRPFGTVLTAMVTPMFDDGTIDYASVGQLAKHLVANGSDGLVVSGTTGESPTTHSPEKIELIKAVREAVGAGVTIVAGAGSNDTAHAVRMAEQAADAGADGLLSVVPYYSKPSQRGIIAHFQEIAEATDLPLMVYDIPGRCGIKLAPSTLDAIGQIDTIVAVKDATGNVPAAKDSMARTGMAWYSGDDALNLDFILAGAAGVVSVASHVVGKTIARMIAAFDAGDVDAARKAQEEADPAIDALMGTGLGAVTAKAAMEMLGVIPSRALRLPHVPLDEEEYEALCAALAVAGVK